MKTLHKSNGFTLLEVVISMGVLSIGILGLVTLQGIAMKSNSSTLSRSQAANLANNIIDAMRVSGDRTNVSLDPAPTCITPLTLDGSIAEQDVAAWRNSIACTLPQGTGSVVFNGNRVTVTVQWNDSRNQTQAEQTSGQDPIQKFTMITNL